MREPLEELAVHLRSTDRRERQLAAKEAGDVLRWTFIMDARPDIYVDGERIRDDIRRQPPTENDEEDLVTELHQLFIRSPDRPDDDRIALLRAIGDAKPWLSAPVFIDLLVDHREALTDEAVHQIVHALDRSLHLIRGEARLSLVAAEFARPRARIVFGEVAAGSRSDASPCMSHDARRILDAIANPVSDQIGYARQYTSDLQASDEEHWPTTRAILRERGIDPRDAAIGEWIPEQEGPFLIVVSRHGRAAILQLRYVQGDRRVVLEDWEDLDPLRGYPYSLDVHAALVVLSERSLGTLDPVEVLVDAVRQETNNLRRDGASFFRWGGLRQFLTEHGIDPARAILIGAGESWSMGRVPQRHGTLLYDGRFLPFVADVGHSFGVGSGSSEIARVRIWQVDEVQARLQHGALIDAALRLEANERRGHSDAR